MFNVGIVQSRRLVVFWVNLIFVTFFATLVGCSQATTDPHVMIMQVHELEEQTPTVEMIATLLNLHEHRYKLLSKGADSRVRFTYKTFINGKCEITRNFENISTDLTRGEELPIRIGAAYGNPPKKIASVGLLKLTIMDLGTTGRTPIFQMLIWYNVRARDQLV